jgi:hypothetical protein
MQRRLKEAIKKHNGSIESEIMKDKTIKLKRFEKLKKLNTDIFNRLRPDVSFLANMYNEQKIGET